MAMMVMITHIFSSRSRPNVTALEYIGPDPSSDLAILKKLFIGESSM